MPNTVICTTVNKVCASGMIGAFIDPHLVSLPCLVNNLVIFLPFIISAFCFLSCVRLPFAATMLAAQSIQLGGNDVVVAGGMESMSNVPKYISEARKGSRLGHDTLVNGMLKDGLWDVYKDVAMGVCAEICAEQHSVTRDEQFDAANSRKLRPSFMETGGTVTAGNVSGISDGASALVLISGKKALELELQVIAKISGYTGAAHTPEVFTTAPALAIPKAISNDGLEASQVDFYEMNEAFAVVALANQKLLGLNSDKVNVHGSAVSLGHPLSCIGAMS